MDWQSVRQEFLNFKSSENLFEHFTKEIKQKHDGDMRRLTAARSIEEVTRLQGTIKALEWVISLLNGDMIKQEGEDEDAEVEDEW